MIISPKSLTPAGKEQITRSNAGYLAELLKISVTDRQFNQAMWGVLEPMTFKALPPAPAAPQDSAVWAGLEQDLGCGCIAYHAVKVQLEETWAEADPAATPAEQAAAISQAANPDRIPLENPGDYAAYYLFPALKPKEAEELFRQYPMECRIQRQDAVAILDRLAKTGRVEWEAVLTPERRAQLPKREEQAK